MAVFFTLHIVSVIFRHGRIPPFGELDFLLLKLFIRNFSRFGTKKSKLDFRFPCLNCGFGLSCEVFHQLGFEVAKKIGLSVEAIFEICARYKAFLILIFDLDFDLDFDLVFDDGVLSIDIF